MVEQATGGDLSKPNVALNRQICQKLHEDESLYSLAYYPR